MPSSAIPRAFARGVAAPDDQRRRRLGAIHDTILEPVLVAGTGTEKSLRVLDPEVAWMTKYLVVERDGGMPLVRLIRVGLARDEANRGQTRFAAFGAASAWATAVPSLGRKNNGFRAWLPVRTSKCRCGPVARPVFPTLAMTWPFLTCWPSFTRFTELWA